MTIGKKLYMNFGIILTMVVVLFLVNWSAVQREHAAKATRGLTTNAVRFQMMQNRLYLSNYLLSGDTREVDRMNEGLRTLNEKLEQGKTLANSDQVKTALAQGAATGAGLGQGIRAAADREAQRCRLGQRHRRRTADLLPAERCFFVGEELHRRAGRRRRREPQSPTKRAANGTIIDVVCSARCWRCRSASSSPTAPRNRLPNR